MNHWTLAFVGDYAQQNCGTTQKAGVFCISSDRTPVRRAQPNDRALLYLARPGSRQLAGSGPVAKLSPMVEKKPVAFVSHSSADRVTVEELARALARSGVDPWHSGWEIGSGDSIVDKTIKGLESCDTFVIVVSQNSVRCDLSGCARSTTPPSSNASRGRHKLFLYDSTTIRCRPSSTTSGTSSYTSRGKPRVAGQGDLWGDPQARRG
jgi:hypothetical protein